jgi:hypothetical protein
MSDLESIKTELKKLKVNELKDKLTEKGLPTTGVKDVLVDRLATAMYSAPTPVAAPTTTAAAAAPAPALVPKAPTPVPAVRYDCYYDSDFLQLSS